MIIEKMVAMGTSYRPYGTEDLGYVKDGVGHVTTCRASMHAVEGYKYPQLLFRMSPEQVTLLNRVEERVVPENMRSLVTQVELRGLILNVFPKNNWLLIDIPWWNKQHPLIHSFLTALLRACKQNIQRPESLWKSEYFKNTPLALQRFLEGRTAVCDEQNNNPHLMWKNSMVTEDAANWLVFPNERPSPVL